MRTFQGALSDALRTDDSLMPWVRELVPLFAEIEAGRISPPVHGLYDWPFHFDHALYGSRSALYHAGAEFQAALEDWRSQPWAQRLYRDQTS